MEAQEAVAGALRAKLGRVRSRGPTLAIRPRRPSTRVRGAQSNRGPGWSGRPERSGGPGSYRGLRRGRAAALCGGDSFSRRRRKGLLRPVLEHGPRSLTCARAFERETPGRSESESGARGGLLGAFRIDGRPSAGSVESERVRWDPKDGELSVSRTKPGETLVEVRSGTDVQIVRSTCV